MWTTSEYISFVIWKKHRKSSNKCIQTSETIAHKRTSSLIIPTQGGQVKTTSH